MTTNRIPETETTGNASGVPGLRRKWRPVLSFGTAIGLLLLICAVLVVWPVVDAQYRTALYWFRVNVGLESIEVDPLARELGLWDRMVRASWQWDWLGSRMILLSTLSVLAIAAVVLSLVHVARRPTRRRAILFSLAGVAWFCLWACHGILLDCTVIRHARLALPRFKAAAIPLFGQWPSQGGVLPEAGQFGVVPGRNPNIILIRNRAQYPCHEDFGSIVERSDAGVLRFDLNAAFDGEIECHPRGSVPRSHRTWSGQESILVESVQLDNDGWYFARYRDPPRNSVGHCALRLEDKAPGDK